MTFYVKFTVILSKKKLEDGDNCFMHDSLHLLKNQLQYAPNKFVSVRCRKYTKTIQNT